MANDAYVYTGDMKVFLGSDHNGYRLKEKVFAYLAKRGIDAEDVGNSELDPSDDFPQFAQMAALKVIGRTPEAGARCLTSAIVAGPETHGQYLSEGQVKRMSVWTRSEEGHMVGKKIWAELLDLCERIAPGAGQVLVR